MIIEMLILFAHITITTTACASQCTSVFLPSYRNMVLNQSASIFALGYFQKVNSKLMLGVTIMGLISLMQNIFIISRPELSFKEKKGQ